MKEFMTKLYCYDHKPVTENVELDSDSDEFHIEIKENVVEEGEDSEVVVAPRREYRPFLRSVGTFGHTKIDAQILVDQSH